MQTEARQPLHLVIWLGLVCAVIYIMIIVGGVTRLTQSGLSMVDWRPIMGVVPPITQEDWQQTFDAYKQYPEYRKLNSGMNLDEFKQIFYWEYGHRLLGRVTGLVYLVPFVVFLLLGRIEKRWQPRLWAAFALGGLQGLMGWYMVKSGLVDLPHVSHYRLAAHLMLAMLILAFIFWVILDMLGAARVQTSRALQMTGAGLMLLLLVQLTLGAFTAGLDAGYGFNTWPLMQGQFIAEAALTMQPFWQNLFANGVMIQFLHRWLAALLLAGALAYTCCAWRAAIRNAALLLLAVTLLQFILGVATLLLRVPLLLASLHQAIACLMLLSLVYIVHITRPRDA